MLKSIKLNDDGVAKSNVTLNVEISSFELKSTLKVS